MTNAMRSLACKQKREISLLNCTDCFQCSFFFFFNFIYLFYFWLHLVFIVVLKTFSSCEQGLLFLVVPGLLISVAFLIAKHRLQVHGLQQLLLAGFRAQAQKLQCVGLVSARRHVKSAWARGQTCGPSVGRQILIHHTTRVVPQCSFNFTIPDT